jgi:lipopolysaccharide export system permease protein
LGTILHRMILWELVKVFVMALVGITGILLLAGIIAEATQQGLSPGQVLAAIPLLIPSTLPYTLPATTLFATCVVYGRLAADNEILAIKASGVNVTAVLLPGVFLGLAMSLATMGLYYRLIPYTHHLLRAMAFNDAEELLYTLLRKHGMIKHPQLPYAMFVQSVQGRKLLSPVFKKRNAKGETDVVARAKEAELRVDMSRNLVLIRMKWGIASGSGEDGFGAFFEDRVFQVPFPENFGQPTRRRARDMTWQEILTRLKDLQGEKEKLSAQLSVQEARLAHPDKQSVGALSSSELEQWRTQLGAQIRHLEDKGQLLDTEERDLRTELQMRPALSLGCLCFILVGCPVGIWISKSDYLSSFVTCFLPIVFVYYPLMLCGTNLAKEGKFDPAVLVWAADAVVAIVGLLLFRRLLKH